MSAGRPDPDRGDGHRRGLLVDFGGVLTTNVFESFRAFCEAEGLEPDAVRSLFRERGEGLALLRQLERGELEVDEFSERFARSAFLQTEQTIVPSASGTKASGAGKA